MEGFDKDPGEYPPAITLCTEKALTNGVCAVDASLLPGILYSSFPSHICSVTLIFESLSSSGDTAVIQNVHIMGPVIPTRPQQSQIPLVHSLRWDI